MRESMEEVPGNLPVTLSVLCIYSHADEAQQNTLVSDVSLHYAHASLQSQSVDHPGIAANDIGQSSYDLILHPCTGIPEQSTVQELNTLSKRYGNVPVVLLLSNTSGAVVNWFTDDLIAGVVMASYSEEQTVSSLKMISTGVRHLPFEFWQTASASNAESQHQKAMLKEKLTPRQLQVMAEVALGKSNRRIAEELSLRESTVKVHVYEAMKRLGATSRTHATHMMR